MQARNTRQVAVYAIGDGAADERGRCDTLGIAGVLTSRHAVFELPFANHRGKRGKSLFTDSATTVGFDNHHLQIAVGTRGVYIADLERARRYGGGVKDVIVLANLDHRIGFGDTTNDRRITPFAVGAHAFIRGQFYPAITYAVEQFGIGEDLAGAELPLECGDVTLHITAIALELVCMTGAGAQIRLVAQPPRAQVDAVAHTQVVGDLRAELSGAAVAVELIVDKPGWNTFVPQLRIHKATHAPSHCQLWHAEIQAQAAGVVAPRGLVNHGRQVMTGLRQPGIQQPLVLQFL